MGVLVLIYTVHGGIKAVTWTDFQQMLIMFVGLFVALFMAVCAAAGRRVVLRRGIARGRGRTAERGRHDVRLERSLQHLERPDRRHVPVPRLFRHRPVAGAAISHRQVDRAEPAQPAVQRRREDPDAVLHPVHGRDGVRVLHLRAAADDVQHRERNKEFQSKPEYAEASRETSERVGTAARRPASISTSRDERALDAFRGRKSDNSKCGTRKRRLAKTRIISS